MPHAVVTGTSSGIGQAIARRLLDGGWHVTGFDRAKPTLDHAACQAVTLDIVTALVNGEVAFRDGQHTGARAGKVLRHSV